MNPNSQLTFRGLDVRAVDVPMGRPLMTGGGEVGSAAMVLVDLLTEEGVTGSSYVFCTTRVVLGPVAGLLSNLAPLIEGDPLAPVAIGRKLQKGFRLLGPQGLTAMATAGIDMAAWDALAKACGLPLAKLLGGRRRARGRRGPGADHAGVRGGQGQAELSCHRRGRGGGPGGESLGRRGRHADGGLQPVALGRGGREARRGFGGRGSLLDRGAHPRRRLLRPRAPAARDEDPRSDRRELVGPERHGQEIEK